MDTTKRTAMIDKIKALLSKTVENGATEHEMLAALNKAAAMRDAYAISDEELQLTKEEKADLHSEADKTISTASSGGSAMASPRFATCEFSVAMCASPA